MASTSYDKHIYSSDSENDDFECPLCLEELDISDKNFRPCPCGYQICRFCWNNIIENYGGRCPACRREYDKQNVQFTPLSEEELKRLKAESKRKKQKRKQGETGRQHLANVRVVQRNLVYVSGLTPKMAVEETLRQPEYFGQFGRIIKVVINRKPATGKPGVSGEVISVYVTYSKKEDAAKAIAAVDGSICDGRLLRASNGTTKYCTYYLRNQVCQNPNCMYLHEPGEDADSLLKDELGHLTSGKLNSNYPPKFFGTAKKGSFSTKEEKEKERVEEAKDDANSLLPPTASWATKKPTIVGRPIAQPPSRTSSFVSESESETHLTNGEQFEDSHSSRTEAEDSRPVSSSSHSKSPAESPKSENRLHIPSEEAPSRSASSAETADIPSFDLTSIINSIPAEVPTLKVLDQVPDKSKDDTLLSPGHFSRLSHLVGGTPQTYSGSFNPFGPANDGIALSANGVQQNFEHIPPPGIGNTLRPPVLQNHNSPNPLALHSNTAGHDPGFGLLNRLLSQSSAPSAPTPIPPPTVFDPFGDVDSRLPPFSTTSPNPAPSRRTGQSRFNFARERSFTPPPTGSPLLQDPIFPGRTEVAPNAVLPFGPNQAFNRQAASPGMAPPPGLNLDQVNIPGIDSSRALPPQLNSVAADLKSNQKSKVSSKFAFANTDEPTPHPSSLQKSSLSEADDFLGQFLKAAKQSNTPVASQVNEPAFPFSDPAIMSVRLGPENHDATPPPSQSNRRLKVFQTFQGSSPEGQVTSPSNPSNSSPNQNMDSPALTVPPQRPANDSRNVTAQPSQKKVNQSTKPPISNQEARKGDQASRIPPPATQLFTIDTQKSPPSKKGGKTVKIKQSDNVQQNKRKESQTDNKQGNDNQKVESKVTNTPSAKSTVESGNQQNGATPPLEPTLSSNSNSLPAISNKAAPELASSPSVAPANKKKKKKKQQQQSSQDKDESTNTSKADVVASVAANANQCNTKSAKATSQPQVNASQNSTNTQFPSHPLDLSNLSQLGLGSLSNFFSFPSSSSSSNPQSSVTLTLNGSGILGTIGNLDANGTAQFASTPADLRTLEQQVEFAKKEAAMLEQELLKIIKRNSSVSLE